jgi:hypothetical protein
VDEQDRQADGQTYERAGEEVRQRHDSGGEADQLRLLASGQLREVVQRQPQAAAGT